MDYISVFSKHLGKMVTIALNSPTVNETVSGWEDSGESSGGWNNTTSWLDDGWNNTTSWQDKGWNNTTSWIDKGWNNTTSWSDNGWNNTSSWSDNNSWSDGK